MSKTKKVTAQQMGLSSTINLGYMVGNYKKNELVVRLSKEDKCCIDRTKKPNVMFLPATYPTGELGKIFLRGYVCHEAAHFRSVENFEKEVKGWKGNKRILHCIWNALEDYCIEYLASKEYLGLIKIFKDLSNEYLKQYKEIPKIKERNPFFEAIAYLLFQVEGLDMKKGWELNKEGEYIKSIIEVDFFKVKDLATLSDNEVRKKEVIELAKTIYKKLEQKAEKQMKEQKDKEEGEEGEGKKNKKKSKKYKKSKNADKNEEDNEHEEGGEEEEGEEEEGGEEGEKKGDTGHTFLEIQSFENNLDEYEGLKDEVLGAILKEDNNNGEYRSVPYYDMTEVIEEGDKQYYDEMKNNVNNKISLTVRELKSSLIASLGKKIFRHKEDGKLDTRRKLVALGTGLRQDVFTHMRKGEISLPEVSILIDQSGSMNGSRINAVQKMCVILCELLDSLRIPFELIGHSTKYNPTINTDELEYERNDSHVCRYIPLIFNIFKSFEENYKIIKYRISNMTTYGANADGEAIEFVAKRMLSRKKNRKIMFVLSDGLPAAGPDCSVTNRHLIKTIEWARENGIEVYGLGILTNSPEQFYGEENFVYCSKVEDLGMDFINQMKKVLC